MTILHLFVVEARKTLKHPALWTGLTALLFLLSMFILADHMQAANGYETMTGGLEQDLLSGLAFFQWIGVLVYASAAAVISAFDYPDRSIQLWLTRGVPRSRLFIARSITILFCGLLLVCFTVSVLLGFGALSRLLFFGVVDTSNLNWNALPLVILRLFWSSLPYLALTVLFAVISRSPLFAAGGTIVYGAVLETLALQAADRFPTLARYLPGSLMRVLQIFNETLNRAAPSLPPDAAIMPETRAIFMIGVMFIGLTAVSFAIFARQDLGG